MKWFRVFHEARTDKKLDSLTDAQHRVWFHLMCFASEQETHRGAVCYDDIDVLAVEVARGDTELLTSTLERLRKLKIITTDDDQVAFINWDKRQHDKPSDLPEATRERQQRSRAQRRDTQQPSNTVTPLSRDVTLGHDTEGEGEGDIDQDLEKETAIGGEVRLLPPREERMNGLKPPAPLVPQFAAPGLPPPKPIRVPDGDWGDFVKYVQERSERLGWDWQDLLAKVEVEDQTVRWQNRDKRQRISWFNWMCKKVDFVIEDAASAPIGGRNGSTKLSAGEKRSANAVTLLKRFETNGGRGGTDPPALPEPA